MSDNQLIVPSEFPVVEHNPIILPVPGVGIYRFLRNPYYEILLKEARESKVPFVFAVTQREHRAFPKSAEGLYQTGVVCSVEAVDANEPRVALFGRYRAKAGKYEKKANDIWVAAFVEPISDKEEEQFMNQRGDMVINPQYQIPLAGLLLNIRNKLHRLCGACIEFAGPDDTDTQGLINLYDGFYNRDLNKRDVIDQLIWEIIFAVPIISYSQKQHVIEQTFLTRRMGDCLGLLELNLEVISSAKRFETAAGRAMRKRRSKRETRQSDGSADDNSTDYANPELDKRWEEYQKSKNRISPEAQKAIEEDFSHLQSCYPDQAEWSMSINHLNCLLTLYSTETTPQEKDISKVEEVLGQSHYGLKDVKDKIYDYLATKIRNPKGKAPILCFVGPPGVGKTSIGRSIAESLGLKFVRLSLGGIRDEAEIRGHRRTYIGATSGKIIQEINRLGSRNPVFMLDEIDKVYNDFRGDPSSALLEVLDPEQNHSFQDHYVGAPFDLSEVLFLCTANLASGIQPALLDRMETIDIAGYTEFEKIHIAIDFLIPEQAIETGFSGLKINWQENDLNRIISKIIKGYTREAGVRELKRQIHQMFSRWGRQMAKNGDQKSDEIVITEELVEKLLGPSKYTHERVKTTEIGEAIGLAWTPVGGDILYIQAELTPHGRTEKDISQTGGLLEVFKDANHNALTVVKNLLRNDKQAMRRLTENLLHLSVPDGGIKKDGPSAGITMALAIYSELVDKPLRPCVAMSGEITVKGRIRAVGGIKEKVLAAHRDGVKEIILPDSNRQDVKHKVPDEIKRELKFHFVSHIKDVLPIVFPNTDLVDNQ